MTLKETVDGIEHSVQMMSEQCDEIRSQLSRQNVDIKDLKARVGKLEESKCDNEVSQLRDETNDLEWRSRRLKLELHGIPPTDNENLLEKMNPVVTRIGVPDLAESEVVLAHRLSLKPGKVPASKRQTRDQWLKKRKKN